MHETRSSQTGMNCGKQGRGLKVDIHALRFPVGCVCDLCMKAHQQAVRFTVRIKVRKAGADETNKTVWRGPLTSETGAP